MWRTLKSVGLLVVVVGLMLGAHVAGRNEVQAKWDAARAAELQAGLQQMAKASAAVAKVGQQVDERVEHVQTITRVIHDRIPALVTPAADRACVVPVGFVRAHDAAAASTDPGPATQADETPSGVALSAVADTVNANYGDCNVYREQVIGWQAFWAQLKAAGY